MAEWLERERRAYALLQWVPYSVPSEFDEVLAAAGHYSRLQYERSTKALDEWDKEHPWGASAELEAFHQLHRAGVFSETDFFSPSKAKRDHYTRRLKGFKAQFNGQGGGDRNPPKNGGPQGRYRDRRRGDRGV